MSVVIQLSTTASLVLLGLLAVAVLTLGGIKAYEAIGSALRLRKLDRRIAAARKARAARERMLDCDLPNCRSTHA